jgi:hypothetical protein
MDSQTTDPRYEAVPLVEDSEKDSQESDGCPIHMSHESRHVKRNVILLRVFMFSFFIALAGNIGLLFFHPAIRAEDPLILTPVPKSKSTSQPKSRVSSLVPAF